MNHSMTPTPTPLAQGTVPLPETNGHPINSPLPAPPGLPAPASPVALGRRRPLPVWRVRFARLLVAVAAVVALIFGVRWLVPRSAETDILTARVVRGDLPITI